MLDQYSKGQTKKDESWKAPTTPKGETPRTLKQLQEALDEPPEHQEYGRLTQKIAPGTLDAKFISGAADIAKKGIEGLEIDSAFQSFNAVSEDNVPEIAHLINMILKAKESNVSLVKKIEKSLAPYSEKPGMTVAKAIENLAEEIHRTFQDLDKKHPNIFDKYFDGVGNTLPGKAADVRNLFEHVLSASGNAQPLNVDELN